MRGALQVGAEVGMVYLDDFNIRPIAEVDDVLSERVDTRNDDDFLELLKWFLNAQIVAFATPVYG